MKKSTIRFVAVFFVAFCSACGDNNIDGTCVAKWNNEFSVADDTIIISKKIVTKRTGYQKIRNGHLKAKAWSVLRWILNDPNSPVIQPGKKEISIGFVTFKMIHQ